jgi:hypothetical protein
MSNLSDKITEVRPAENTNNPNERARSPEVDLQHDQPTVYDHPPTSLEAMRMIHRAHPALIRGAQLLSRVPSHGNCDSRLCEPGCGSNVLLGASEDWDAPETYERVAGDRVVTIAITDDGWVWARVSLITLRQSSSRVDWRTLFVCRKTGVRCSSRP